MSIVNLKIIFVKKQKRHANAQLNAGAQHLLQQKWLFTLETDHSCVRRVNCLMIRVR